VQHLSAIVQTVDTALATLRDGDASRAEEVLARAVELSRNAARELRTLSEDLEPKALRELGFAVAVAALGRRYASRHDVEMVVDVDHGDELGEHAQTALYQILREAIDQAVRRGAPTRIEISLAPTPAGGAELVVSDDGPPERRSAVLEALAERAATLNGRFSSEVRYPRGSTVRVELPPSAARR
jgi:signal transduction histidine kinase